MMNQPLWSLHLIQIEHRLFHKDGQNSSRQGNIHMLRETPFPLYRRLQTQQVLALVHSRTTRIDIYTQYQETNTVSVTLSAYLPHRVHDMRHYISFINKTSI